ncbi:NADPH-dependent FMN reductase [Streptomyces specialis]|uniref:NADPH-dependent FMN reductase n=1 Tax=Streptomyces specialis TaxID=498367 RepID=UPI00073E7000|nr:NADPH-dependent FMN reductase [Streptomyces specialis]
MATVLSISGSPSPTSRTARLLRHLDGRLVREGHAVVPLDVRALPPEALTGADPGHPAISEVASLLGHADGVVIGTPVYKAAYSGLLKSLLDLLPQYALAGKTVLPLATGGTLAHVLAIDYALRPVLSTMGATHITPGWFVLDRDITLTPDGDVSVEPAADGPLTQALGHFTTALDRAAFAPAAAGA